MLFPEGSEHGQVEIGYVGAKSLVTKELGLNNTGKSMFWVERLFVEQL